MKRTLSIPAIVLVAVVALVLGSFGSATAASLTKGQVKKIAAKVVDKKAASLSVAKAKTADTAVSATTAANATLLSGSTAAQLKTTQYQFRLPTQAAASTRVYTFPTLPAGNYFATYSVLASASSLLCYFQNGGGPYEALSYGADGGGYFSASNSAFLPVSSATHLTCNGTAFAVNAGGSLSNVTFTPIDTPVAATGTGARGTTDGAGAAAGAE